MGVNEAVSNETLGDNHAFNDVVVARRKGGSKLSLVSERLCDEELEDSHAFSDVVVTRMRLPSSNSVHDSSANNSVMLETLDEDDEDYLDNNIDEKDGEKDREEEGQKILIDGLHTINQASDMK